MRFWGRWKRQKRDSDQLNRKSGRGVPPLRKPTIQQEVGWRRKDWLAAVGMTGWSRKELEVAPRTPDGGAGVADFVVRAFEEIGYLVEELLEHATHGTTPCELDERC